MFLDQTLFSGLLLAIGLLGLIWVSLEHFTRIPMDIVAGLSISLGLGSSLLLKLTPGTQYIDYIKDGVALFVTVYAYFAARNYMRRYILEHDLCSKRRMAIKSCTTNNAKRI